MTRTSFRSAELAERTALEELQRRSSMHEPMYRAQLAAHPDAIDLPAEQIRGGLGRRLIEDAKGIARQHGATRIDVVANPQAVAFYERVGFRASGLAETRFGTAPRMSLALDLA